MARWLVERVAPWQRGCLCRVARARARAPWRAASGGQTAGAASHPCTLPATPPPCHRQIFCGNFEYDATERDIMRLFERFGSVDRIDMKTGERTAALAPRRRHPRLRPRDAGPP